MINLLNRRELINELDKRFKYEEYSIQIEHFPDYVREWNTPIPIKDKYICIGYVNVWNDVGCVEYCFKMYKPRKNGTILYDFKEE